MIDELKRIKALAEDFTDETLVSTHMRVRLRIAGRVAAVVEAIESRLTPEARELLRKGGE